MGVQCSLVKRALLPYDTLQLTTCPTYLILAPIASIKFYTRDAGNAYNSAAKNEEEKKEDATEQHEDPKTSLKKMTPRMIPLDGLNLSKKNPSDV